MRVAFAGTPDFAARALQALINSPHVVVGVLTQPDRPSGRGRKLSSSPVKQIAQAAGIPVLQPRSLREDTGDHWLSNLAPEVMVVAAYGLIVPQRILDLPAHGCINIHASLLPRWRGAAPIQRAIEAGDPQTGICIMQMEAGLDTGPLLLCESIGIEPLDTAGSLHDRLATLGARLMLEALTGLQRGGLTPVPQDETAVTYASKLDKAEARLDWQLDATTLERRIRAFNPWPTAFTLVDDGVTGRTGPLRLRVLQARVVDQVPHDVPAGTVLCADRTALDVACGRGVLRLIEVQPAGRKPMTSAQLLQSTRIVPGTLLT